ncbi:hypothetical protein [Streptomyces sp. NPDC002671]
MRRDPEVHRSCRSGIVTGDRARMQAPAVVSVRADRISARLEHRPIAGLSVGAAMLVALELIGL